MRQALTNDPLHNPFDNRFNDPVTRRHDEMQADAYMMWLRERSQGCGQTQSEHNPSLLSVIAKGAASVSKEVESRHGGRIFAGVLALVLVISVAALLKAI
jgi:hypothetical protein